MILILLLLFVFHVHRMTRFSTKIMIFNDIYISGSSGGLATYLNCDRVAAMLSPSTRFACLADAGYFLDHTARDGTPTTSPQFKESFYAWNSSAGTNQVRPGASTGGGGGGERGGSSLSGFFLSLPLPPLPHTLHSHAHIVSVSALSLSPSSAPHAGVHRPLHSTWHAGALHLCAVRPPLHHLALFRHAEPLRQLAAQEHL